MVGPSAPQQSLFDAFSESPPATASAATNYFASSPVGPTGASGAASGFGMAPFGAIPISLPYCYRMRVLTVKLSDLLSSACTRVEPHGRRRRSVRSLQLGPTSSAVDQHAGPLPPANRFVQRRRRRCLSYAISSTYGRVRLPSSSSSPRKSKSPPSSSPFRHPLTLPHLTRVGPSPAHGTPNGTRHAVQVRLRPPNPRRLSRAPDDRRRKGDHGPSSQTHLPPLYVRLRTRQRRQTPNSSN